MSEDWNYVSVIFNDTANKLNESKSSLRRALAKDVRKLAEAMHAIQKVDEGDYGEGDEIESMQDFLGHDWTQKQTQVLVDDARELIKELSDLIEKVEK